MTFNSIESAPTSTVSIPTRGPSSSTTTYVLHRNLVSPPHLAITGSNSTIRTETSSLPPLLDAACGASVSVLGHTPPPSVTAAITTQLAALPYVYTGLGLTTSSAEDLASFLLRDSPGGLQRALFLNSGSEAMEAALKAARQYHYERGDTKRDVWVARKQSYHGNTLGALAISGHDERRKQYVGTGMLNEEKLRWLEPCYKFRGMKKDEGERGYGQRLVAQLEEVLRRESEDGEGKGCRVAAVVMETMSGMSLGAVGPVEGYLAGVKKVCEKYGVLLILDEVMCGMGKLGTHLHAWQHSPDFPGPDIQTIAKSLGAGYQPISAVLLSSKIVSAMTEGSGALANGHTYQAHPIACATALAVQEYIASNNILDIVTKRGELLTQCLQEEFDGYRKVGDIRGKGLFQAVEFVEERETMKPHPADTKMGLKVAKWAMEKEGLLLLPSVGKSGDLGGEFVLLSLRYEVPEDEVRDVVKRLGRAVRGVLGE